MAGSKRRSASSHAQFYFAQDLESLKDCFKQAFLKRGIPERLYVDNTQIFRSKQLLAVAAQIGFHLLYSKPYRPEGLGKIERWFLNVRSSFLSRLDLPRIESIDRLNRLLWAWIEGEYHLACHRGIVDLVSDARRQHSHHGESVGLGD